MSEMFELDPLHGLYDVYAAETGRDSAVVDSWSADPEEYEDGRARQ